MSEKEREAMTLGREANPSYRTLPSQNPPAPSTPDPVMSLPTPLSLPPAVQDSSYWRPTVATVNMPYGTVPQGAVTPPPGVKSLLEAYLLGLPLGFLGAHHFYLGRPCFGILYFFTLGLLGCGWLIDLIRMPCLVSQVNRANKEKHKQLQSLQQQLQFQRLQQVQDYGPSAAQQMRQNVVFVAFEPRSLVDAYVLWFPFGLLGFHHYYLRNYAMGIVYTLTLGVLGIGWLVDLFRMPGLVRDANLPKNCRGFELYNPCAARALAMSPAGIVGGHHFYLNRPVWGCLYVCTLGLLGVGWLFDWFRISCLAKRANAVRQGYKSADKKYLDDAYILCLPFGFLGLHHFYLRRYGWGILYFCTLGIFGIGWLVDWCRLPCLVRDYNSNLEASQQLISTVTSGGTSGAGVGGAAGAEGGGVVNAGMANPTQGMAGVPGPCPPAAGYGGYHQAGHPGPAPYDAACPSYMASTHSRVGDAGPGMMPPPPQYSATCLVKQNASAVQEHDVAPPVYEEAMRSNCSDTKQ